MTKRAVPALAALAILLAVTGPTLSQPIEMSPGRAAAPAAANGSGVVRYGKYYEDRVSGSCVPNYINCILDFAKLPDTRHVRFTRIACASRSSNAPISLTLGANNGPPGSPYRMIALPVAPYTYAQQILSTNYIYYMNINEELDVIMNRGSTPYINFYTSGSSPYETLTISCTLTGEII